jgi:2-oxo-3-hexenedioate decarboxylase
MSDLAARLMGVLDRGDRLEPFPESFDLPAAYRLQHAVSVARERRGARRVGRKIGFTNTTIWTVYNVHAPIWGPVWDATHHPGATELSLGHLPEPRIEPEIVLRLGQGPEPGMDAAALAACIDAVAPGFEIVQSPYPGWRFRAPDTVAAFALHGALVTGAWHQATPARLAGLTDFAVTLERDGATVAQGRGAHVMGAGPLAALAHLLAVLANDPDAPPLRAGEIVSTGTLTDAIPVAPGQDWRFATDLTWLPPLSLRLTP